MSALRADGTFRRRRTVEAHGGGMASAYLCRGENDDALGIPIRFIDSGVLSAQEVALEGKH